MKTDIEIKIFERKNRLSLSSDPVSAACFWKIHGNQNNVDCSTTLYLSLSLSLQTGTSNAERPNL